MLNCEILFRKQIFDKVLATLVIFDMNLLIYDGNTYILYIRIILIYIVFLFYKNVSNKQNITIHNNYLNIFDYQKAFQIKYSTLYCNNYIKPPRD